MKDLCPLARHLGVALLCVTLAGCPGGDDEHAVGAPCDSDEMCGTAKIGGRKKKLVCLKDSAAGYCSYPHCEGVGCPDETVCVVLREHEDDAGKTYCLLKCTEDGSCQNHLRAAGQTSSCAGELEVIGAEHEPAGLKACLPPEPKN